MGGGEGGDWKNGRVLINIRSERWTGTIRRAVTSVDKVPKRGVVSGSRNGLLTVVSRDQCTESCERVNVTQLLHIRRVTPSLLILRLRSVVPKLMVETLKLVQ